MEKLLDRFLSDLRANKAIEYVPENSVVCDLGCGEGKLLRKIKDKNKKLIGIDIRTRNRNEGGIKFMNHDLNNDLPLENDSVDCILSLAILEHLYDYNKNLKECYRVLKDKGILILTTPAPNSKWIIEFLGKLNLLDNELIREHKNYFNIKELEKILVGHGFSQIDSKKFEFGFNNLVVAKK